MDMVGLVLSGLSIGGIVFFVTIATMDGKRVDRMLMERQLEYARSDARLDLGRLRLQSLRMEWCDMTPEGRRMYVDLYGEPSWVKESRDGWHQTHW